MRTTITEYYDEVKITGRKSGKCACGKRLVRQTTFSQTINPFNKNADGRIKTEYEIIPELKIERSAWEAEGVHCDYEGYWKWSKEQREQYDTEGFTTVVMKCGFEKTVYKSKK